MVAEDTPVDGTLPFEEVESPVSDCEGVLCIVSNINMIGRENQKTL